MHPSARIEIPDVTIGEFITKYLSANGRRNRISEEISINSSVKLIIITVIWGIELTQPIRLTVIWGSEFP